MKRVTDIAHFQISVQPSLADARVQNRRFPTRMSADEKNRIGRLQARNRRIEKIRGPRPAKRGAILAAIDVDDA